jgi:nitrite reductase/ring-hydroxylating ferredoxin subunit
MSEVLCRVEEIEDPGAKGFSLAGSDRPREIFVVRTGDVVNAYVNSCPHIGTPLEFQPDRFLTQDRREILCSTHGARFEIASGHCIAGPCRGQSLRRVPVKVAEGWVRLSGPAR